MQERKNPWPPEAVETLKRMEAQLEARGLSEGTRRGYENRVGNFVRRLGVRPSEITATQVEDYFVFLTRERGLVASSRNTYGAALKFYFDKTLGRPELCKAVVTAREKRPLPTVLSGTEVKQLFASLRSPMFRTIAMVCYGAGLRCGEACRLTVDDIDSQRMVLWVREGKGGKDRQVALGKALLKALRNYWRVRRPQGRHLFPGRRREPPYVSRSAFLKALTKAVRVSGIDKPATPHTLRHSYATHLIEAGADVRTVQLFLGHASLRTTMRYIHLTHARMQRVANPLDVLTSKKVNPFG